MSALAARRAAALASSSSSPAPTSTPTKTPIEQVEVVLNLTSDESEDESEHIDPGPSKRRRVETSPKPRYFVAPTPKSDRPKRQVRRFSPSAPVSESEGSSDEDAAEEVDEGRAVWQVPTVAGPSALPVVESSIFTPREGYNVCRMSQEVLTGVPGIGPGVIISLGTGESLTLSGVFNIIPLSQGVSLFSSTLRPKSETPAYPIFAPTSHPLPVLRAIPGDITSIAFDLPSTFKSDQTIFLLREHRCGIEGLSVPGFTNVWPSESSWGVRGLQINNTGYPHITPTSWTAALSSFKEDPVVLIKGPKRSGKSSFGRASVNKLLEKHEKVAWLECDLGQGEFGCGGVVGLWVLDKPLLGPPFTHPKSPMRACYLGALSPQSCPDEYLAALQQMITFYRFELQYSKVPLVVNTQGWVKGLGEDLLRSIEGMVAATHTFAFEDEQATFTEANMALLTSAPISPLQARYTPADHRLISMISYFHSRGSIWDFSVPLLAIRPWQVELGTTIKRVYLIGEGADGIFESDLNLALNGSIVALTTSDDDCDDAVYVQGSLPPAETTNFLGLAIIRAVSGNKIHLLTPVSSSTLEKTSMLVKNGAMELPLVGMLDWEERWDEMPYLEVGGEGVGVDKRRFRRNLMRKGM